MKFLNKDSNKNIQNKNYNTIMESILDSISRTDEKPSLLLHSCCAPCSSPIIEFLCEYFNITIFFYNPNITEETEYLKRRDEHISFIKNNNLSISFIEGNYNVKENFFIPVKGHEKDREGEERCSICYQLRIMETARIAKIEKFDFFSTVLSVSPMKNVNKINIIGEMAEEKYEIRFLYADFKKKNRYKRSIELSKEYNLYRQDYCGCIFSKEETKNKNYSD